MTITLEERPPQPAGAVEPGSPRWADRRWLDPRYIVLIATSVLVAYLVLVPVGTMVFASLRSSFLTSGPAHWTVSNYTSTFRSQGFGTMVITSLEYAGASSIVATVLGFSFAWLVSRTNMPGKPVAYAICLLPLVLPGIVTTVAWAVLFDPQSGPLNSALSYAHLPTFNIYSLGGMVFVQSLTIMPLAFLMGVSAYGAMDPSLEEAALTSGASPFTVQRRITLQLIKPAILSAALVMFVMSISNFEVPQLIGVPSHRFVFVSEIYNALQQYPPNYGTVAVIGVMVLAVASVGLWYSQRASRRLRAQTVTGKAFRPTLRDIGRWRWPSLALFVLFFLVAVALPVAMLTWSSLLPSYEPPSVRALSHLSLHNYQVLFHTPALAQSLRNSVITAVSAGLIVTVVASIAAYISVKTRVRGRGVLDGLATTPIAVPGILLGVGLLYWYLVVPSPFRMYGTLAILIVAFVTAGLPYGLRFIAPAFHQISDELEEAATINGASWLQVFRRIYLPLLAPSLVATCVFVIGLAFREVSSAILLYSQKSTLLTITLYSLWSTGSDLSLAEALGVLLFVLVAGLVIVTGLIGWAIGGKSGLAKLRNASSFARAHEGGVR